MRLVAGCMKLHQLGAVGAVDPSVVAPHYPLVLLVGTGRDRGAIAGVCVPALAVLHAQRPRTRKKSPTRAAAPRIHQMNFTITAMSRSKPNNAPNEPLEFDLDRRLEAIMPATIRGPTDNNVTDQMDFHDG